MWPQQHTPARKALSSAASEVEKTRPVSPRVPQSPELGGAVDFTAGNSHAQITAILNELFRMECITLSSSPLVLTQLLDLRRIYLLEKRFLCNNGV